VDSRTALADAQRDIYFRLRSLFWQPDDKFVLFQLAKDIHDGRSVLTEVEFTTLKTTIGKVYDQAIMGAAWRELDNQAAKHQRQSQHNTQATPTE
jgi:hypothetical protein